MDDLISRQALLDAFGFSEKTHKWGGDHSGYNTMMLYEIQDMIESAPSVISHEPSRDMKEIEEIINCDADAETKCKMISNILTAKPHYFEKQEPKTGHWICGLSWKCSECGYEDDRALGTDFCPNCGAMMVEEQESEDKE